MPSEYVVGVGIPVTLALTKPEDEYGSDTSVNTTPIVPSENPVKLGLTTAELSNVAALPAGFDVKAH